MSSSPKYSQAQLERERRERLEQERERKAAEEARIRAAAAERERLQRLETLRNQSIAQTQATIAKIQQKSPEIYPQDSSELAKRGQNLLNSLRGVTTEYQLQNTIQELPKIEQELDRAISRKRRDDEEKKRKAELEKQQFELEELEREIAQIPQTDAIKFDRAGRTAAQTALKALRSAIASGNPQTARSPLNTATAAVEQHIASVARNRAQWQQQKAAAEQALGELEALIIGLKADPVAKRWQIHLIDELATQLQTGIAAIEAEQFDKPALILAAAKTQEQEIIATANAAQIQADQRDYIAKSIAETLAEMGFFVNEPQLEYPDHPKTSLILKAATNSGKGISISVPVEGEVLYDVDGYSKTTEAAVGGGTAAVCDEAEKVLTEMHDRLGAEFGINMSEVTWEGKDPDRELIEADELPNNDQQQNRTGN
ncbi:MAG: hypothetical protein EAZ96_03870 [Oscillatoriales cyanobacterium]|nr:MAG: hypothetical protein EAZ96_03870 [Oscillatoriales cyanobacterium]